VVEDFPLRAICHTCGFLGEGVPNFEIRDVAGDATDLLIRNRTLGQALAKTLGSASVVVMRGHGSTTVGRSVPQAVYRAIYCETNAHIQASAARLGPVNYLTAAEADAAESTSEAQVERNWALWVKQLDG
jgi:HCOMODA/2-hydroxy-3-carboxy-muconic semialdehyde decarboxylase